MKYWEVIADKLHVADWSWGYCSAVTPDGWRWTVDAHSGARFVDPAQKFSIRGFGVGCDPIRRKARRRFNWLQVTFFAKIHHRH
jgi:hypothetical protein